MTLTLDHVLVAVPDLAEAADLLRDDHGLASVEGGRHPAWGTANRIVPLGDGYLELVTVVDPPAAERGFGRWVAASTAPLAHGLVPMGWAVRSDDLAGDCARLGLDAAPGERQRADGTLLTWSLAGVDEAAARPCLPFFIAWGADTPLPGRTRLDHPRGRTTLAGVRVHGEPDELGAWLGPGGAHLPVTTKPGPCAVTGIVLSTGQEPWTLGPSGSRQG